MTSSMGGRWRLVCAQARSASSFATLRGYTRQNSAKSDSAAVAGSLRRVSCGLDMRGEFRIDGRDPVSSRITRHTRGDHFAAEPLFAGRALISV